MRLNNNSAIIFTNNAVHRIEKICEPLQRYLGIDFFSYIRIYNDCSYLTLRNGYQEFSQKYFNYVTNPDPIYLMNLRHTPLGESSLYLWPVKFSKLPYVASLLISYDIWHGLTIFYRSEKYCEIFNFAFNKNSENKNQFYMENSTLLKDFCSYFKMQASDLIREFNNDKLAIYENVFDISFLPTNQNKYLFLNSISQIKNKFYINKEGEFATLTEREIECIKLMMQHKTTKKIAKVLDISPRTVETHLGHVKRKLSVNFKSELAEIILHNNKYN